MQTWTDAGGAAVRYVEVRSPFGHGLLWGCVRVCEGAPSGPPEARPSAAAAFEAQARAEGARVLWFGVEHLRDLGPSPRGRRRPSVVIGAEPVWRAGRWPEIVAAKSSVRAQIRRARNKGLVVEVWPAERARQSGELGAVLAEWLATRGLPPLAFMASPFVLDEPGRRLFWIARREADVVGYLALRPGDEAPDNESDQGEAFVEWIIQGRAAPNGTAALLLDAAVRSLPPEAGFTLGLVPLSTQAPPSASAPPLAVRALLAWTRAHATRFYNFDGLERFKTKFVPDGWRPLHLATDGPQISLVTFHAVAAAFAAPRGPTRFVARALADALGEEARTGAGWLLSLLSGAAPDDGRA